MNIVTMKKAYRALKESLKYLREAKGAHIDNMITALGNAIVRFKSF